MNFRIILPKYYPVLNEFRKQPLFFLAGPILGADDWHKDMTELLATMTGGDCIVVNPSRYTSDHPHYAHRIDDNEGFFANQTWWEREYLTMAGETWHFGCIVFWLPEESQERPRTDGKPYACDTRGEIGEWRWRLKTNPLARVVMGAEPGFPGLSVIEKNNDAVVPNRLPILSTMEEVAERAVHRAFNRR